MNRIIPAIACLSLIAATTATVPAAVFAQADAPPPAAAPTPTPASQIDAAAMTILRKSRDKMFGLKTFRAECWETTTFAPTDAGKSRSNRYEMATLTAAKPNLMRYDKWEMIAPKASAVPATWKRKQATPTYTFVNDGKTFYKQFGTSYRKDNRTGAEYINTILEPWGGFYTTNSSPHSNMEYSQKQGDLLELRLEGTQTVGNMVCDVIHSRVSNEYNGETLKYDSRLFVGRDDIVRRKTETVQFGGKPGITRDAMIRNVVTNAPIKSPKTTFAYTPPKGVKSEVEMKAAEPVLLTSGTPAPDFSATDAGGTVVKLSDLRGKVVVVDFWASWCPPCVASMPHNQKVIKKLQDEGLPVVLLAVDDAEEQDAFAGWVKKHPEFDALRFVFADRKKTDISGKLYHVSGIPTQYVVDASGMIRSSSVGFGGENDDMEKAIRAALVPKAE